MLRKSRQRLKAPAALWKSSNSRSGNPLGRAGIVRLRPEGGICQHGLCRTVAFFWEIGTLHGVQACGSFSKDVALTARRLGFLFCQQCLLTLWPSTFSGRGAGLTGLVVVRSSAWSRCALGSGHGECCARVWEKIIPMRLLLSVALDVLHASPGPPLRRRLLKGLWPLACHRPTP